MKSKLKHILIVFQVVLFFGTTSFAQDVHFSQFDAAPLYFNPSQSGLFDCNHRFIGNFKGQWSTYNSIMLSYDQPFKYIDKLVDLKGDRMGLGALVYSDHSGENSYGNTQLRIMPAYHKDVSSTLRVSFGLNMMLNIAGIDETTVILPGGVDPLNGSGTAGVDFENPTKMYADLGVGLNVKYDLTPQFPIYAGATLDRLFGSGGGGIASGVKHPNYRRLSFNANSVVPVNSLISLLPSFIFQDQNKYFEMNFGSYARYNTESMSQNVSALYAGAWMRYGDALIFGVAFDSPNSKGVLNVGLSYDMTISSFRVSDKWANTNNVGKNSLELSVKFIQCTAPIVIDPEGIINDPFR